jgi:DNA-binding Lrp family transcriptional regulator
MDDLDLDLVRWMYPGGVWSPWGTDPRISVAEIASHVGLNRTAVWARFRKWRRVGFWDGFETHVNVRIFDVGLLVASFRVSDSAEGWDLVDRVGEIEGVLGGSLHFGDSLGGGDVEHVGVTMVNDGPAGVLRRLRALTRLSPTGVVDGPVPVEPPPCARELTPLDWRILEAMLAYPNASAPRVAQVVRVSSKTFDHHRSALIDDHVVTSAPKFNWSKIGCVTLSFYCHAAGDVGGAARALTDRIPHSIPVSQSGFSRVTPDFEASNCFSFIVPAHSPNEVQTLVRDLSQLPGVTRVRPELWGPWRGFPYWVTERIAQRLTAPPAVVAPPPLIAVGRAGPEPGKRNRVGRPVLVAP